MRHMSCRNVTTLLDCLSSSFATAEAFDRRPGLKFLMQKVARCEVAANLYKQAGVSRLFYVHALLEISARWRHLSVDRVKRLLATTDLSAVVDTVQSNAASDVTRSDDASVLAPRPASQPPCTLLELAAHSTGAIYRHSDVFVARLKQAFDAVCTNYIDLYVERDGPNQADELSSRLLVFLVAADDDVPRLPPRDNSLRTMIEEKIKERSQQVMTSDASAASLCVAPVVTAAVQQQGKSTPCCIIFIGCQPGLLLFIYRVCTIMYMYIQGVTHMCL